MKDRVIELKTKYRPEAAISGGLLLQSEIDGVLIFNAMEENPDKSWHNAGTGILKFVRMIKSKFGSPNDEARPGHPLYKVGLDKIAYGFAEVEESSWRAEEERVNQVRFPVSNFAGFRHFVVTFHDSTFECLAEDFELKVSTKPRTEIIMKHLAEIYR